MDFLKYANETHTNIFPKENFSMLVHEVFGVISKNICKSLGPLGSAATILDGITEPEATKDGYAILNKYRFRNDYKRMIYNLIKAPCTRMNNTVGDGTTTVIDLTNSMLNRYNSRYSVLEPLYRLPRQFTKTWDTVVSEIESRIKDKATPIDASDYDTIYNIAYVTSNGNHEISDAIAKVYTEAEAPVFRQKESNTNKSYIELIDGFSFPANLLNHTYVKNEDMSAEENDVAVMVCNFKIESDFFQSVIIPVNSVFRAKHTKLIIVASSYDELMCDTILEQYVTMEARTGGINLIPTQYSKSNLKPHALLDLCAVLNTKILNKSIADVFASKLENDTIDSIIEKSFIDPTYELSNVIGTAKHVSLSLSAGSVFKVGDLSNNENYQSALNNARSELNDLMKGNSIERSNYNAKIQEARERVLQLEMKNYIYYIGADSNLQRNIIWDAVTDVIKCVRSSVSHGIVPGCQLTIISICDDMISELSKGFVSPDEITEDTDPSMIMDDETKLKIEILYIIQSACLDVYSHVLYGPENMGIIKMLPRWQYTPKEGIPELRKSAAEKCSEILQKSIELNEVFNIETMEYDKNIITSAETDQMVLLAASELIKILISSNQCIIINPAIDNDHETDIEVPV